MRILLAFLALSTFIFGQKPVSISRLIAEVSEVTPGKAFTVALKIDHPKDWHSYYRNSGGVEKSPEIEWNLPEGARAGEIQWPTPEVQDGYGAKSFVYSGSPIFLIEITPSASLSPGDTFTFGATAEWQICKKSCVNESAEFSLGLPVAAKATLNPEQAALFQTARQLIPGHGSEPLVAAANSTSESSDEILLQLPEMKDRPTDFIPNEPYIKALSDGGKVTENSDGILLTLQRKKTDFLDDPIPQGSTVSGILTADTNILVSETNIALPEATQPKGQTAFLAILWGMFLGGLLLNLMPCVFPVIGLKIMGFVQQAGKNRRSIALHGISFAGGVFTSFAVLSGILFALRNVIGWGFQLQNPWVVLVLLLLIFVLALNMFGVFEMGTSATSIGGNLQGKSGHAGSFFSGVLATVVATPCSAPFLGAAIGAVMTLPAWQFFTGFGLMAAGLALPYLVLSLFPQFVELLPRPGAWMESFKQAMSFLLFATAAYLLWVYSALVGTDNLLPSLLGLTLVAAATWVYGRWNLPYKPKRTRAIALAVTIGFAATGAILAFPPNPEGEEHKTVWETWSQETVDKLLAEGTPVYIDFTARWCVTCQVNKKVAYTDEVMALAKKKGIVFFRADKTKPDLAIEAKLQELGRTAIPVNVLILPGEEPVITPEILTPGILKDLFNKAP
jgi:thiol:disulfide interchange protein